MSTSTGPRFSELTLHNHQAWLWNTSLMSLCFAFLTLGMRLVVKWRMYGLDDMALGVAYALALGHWSTLYAALRDGVGKDMTLVSNSALEDASKLIYTSRILLLLALSFSQCTVFLFIRNLFTRETLSIWRTCNISSVFVVAWGVASALIASIGCSASQLLADSSTTCPAEDARWIAIVVVDVVLEILIAVMATYFFSGLHMRLNRKITVISAFYFRLPTVAIFIVFLTSQLHYVSASRTTNVNTSLAMIDPLICLEALICYSLLSATIPCLRGFLGRFRTGDLTHVDDSTRRYGYGHSGEQATNQSYQLKSIKSLKNQKRESDGAVDEQALFKGNAYGHNAGVVEHTANAAATYDRARYDTSEENHSMQSVGSEEMIIHRQTVVEVRRD